MKLPRHPVWVVALPALLAAQQLAATSIWIEGESATRKSVTPHGWYNSVKKDVLSGGEWLSHFDPGKPGNAIYQFASPETGDFTFWIRANHLRASLSYRLNGNDWQKIDLENHRRGAMNIAADNKPDLRFLSWNKAGQVQLRKGTNNIEFRMDSGPQNHGAIDCFAFTNEGWVPSGTRQPGTGAGKAGPSDWFPVVFDDDPLSQKSVIDMSSLIEAPAGRHGFLKRQGDALEFQKATTPTKFWAIGSSPGGMSDKQMRQAARWYRKHGINLVRQHTVLGVVGLLNRNGEFDRERLEHYDRWFAAMKAEGIYTTWSVIYPHHGPFLQKHDGYDPRLFAELDRADRQHDGDRQAIVVNDFINLDRRLQDIAFRYFHKLLNHVNPHTGLAYKDDPALAVLEFQNESNVYFHTLNGLRGGKEYPLFSEMMRKAFFRFIKHKYGSKESVARAWNNRWDRFDNWEQGELGLMGAAHWGADGPLYEFRGQARRAGDYIEFLADLQRTYYQRRESEVRNAGFQGVTVTTAWKSGGPAASMANLYADISADMIDRHNYFGGGEGRHRIVEGKVHTGTHLSQPGHGLLNLALFQVKDRPFGVSEWSMMPPSPWKAEAAPLYAFYGMGLQGWDASCHFNGASHRMGDGWPGQSKYVSHTPHYMGQFPALAFAIHNGHIQEGQIVADRHVSKADIFAGKDVLGQSLSGGGFDDKKLAGRLTTPAEAVAIGRVTISFDDRSSQKKDLSPYWDRARKTLTSTTGELLWDYGKRVVQVRSDKTQAIIGFAGSQSFDLPGATVSVKTPFVSLILTPLDNRELEASKHILITAMARDKQSGAEYNPDGSRLLALGGPPLLMEPVQATIQLQGPRPTQVRPLDIYGVPHGEPVKVSANGSFTIDGTHRTYYYEVRRN